ncbi:PREDICTED: phospholipase B1, membrane-associated-like [Eufriesea mexicana]|uniref:phospholipase B1, membrane-associated-like n=1 Tax=Eufriesea mexicana TaxID=516756 RepID=UPI00083C14A7|nr:PREDICTED: phospholipase B1, membrane-associated-like [Eufriesea mexicana]
MVIDKKVLTIETMHLWLILILLPAVSGSFMDFLRSIFQSGRDDVDKTGIVYPVICSGVRNQPQVPDYVPFPCNVQFGRSLLAPDSVHRLRPGDIDVVGGLGDSLVAGSGALEEFAIGTFIEARGVSWCVGGQGDWRRFLTVPNLLKVFNPDLIGYSTGTGEFISSKAKLNIAFPVAATEDALQQAQILVQRIKNDPRIDIRKHWKLITIFFGANDICSAQCYSPAQFSPLRYALHLRRTLDFLKIVLPRTLVNLVPVIDVTVSIRVPRSTMCHILHPLYCACMHKGSRPDIAASKMSHLYQQAIEALIYSGRYDKSPDFTVVLQPFIKLFNAPNADPRGAPPIDPSLVTYDCFHFSQKGHALGANLLWNNMLEPVGNKTDQGLPEIFERLLCPNENAPYIFTNVNSRHFRMTGRQDGIVAR